MTAYYLGIDAGASATKWALADSNSILSTGKCDPLDGHVYSEESSRRFSAVLREIQDAIQVKKVVQIVAGITGLGNDPLKAGLIEKNFSLYFPKAKLRLLPDINLAYLANYESEAGIFLYAGTGTVAITQLSNGNFRKVGGWGYLLGDEGGGYWIGREAIRTVLSEIDTRAVHSDFSAKILNAMNCYDWNDIREYVYGRNRSEVAKLARDVSQLANTGDVLAQSIVSQASFELIKLVSTLDEGAKSKVVFGGGLALDGSYLHKQLGEFFKNRLSIGTANIAIRAAEMARD